MGTDEGRSTPASPAAPTATGRRRPGRLLLTWSVAAAVLVLGFVVLPAFLEVLDQPAVRVLGRRIVELWLLVGLAIATFRGLTPPAVTTRALRVVVGVVAVGLLVGQFSPVAISAYPFTSWGMYTTPAEQVAYTDYVLVAGGRDLERLPIVDLVPARDRGFMARLDSFAVRAADGDEAAGEVLATTLRRLVDAHGDPHVELVDAVEVRRCVVTGSGDELTTECSRLLTVAR